MENIPIYIIYKYKYSNFVYSHLGVYIAEGSGMPLHCSCLENPMDGRAWWAAFHGVVK